MLRCFTSVKYHCFHRFFTYACKRKATRKDHASSPKRFAASCSARSAPRDEIQGWRVWLGWIHLSNGKRRCPRRAQRGQNLVVEQKGQKLAWILIFSMNTTAKAGPIDLLIYEF
ncbi:hypothetical protein JTE90_012645 [Oedothorax gibbosus]|uniref:Uncharacterized protein n=1 Tax=Oedothorax gibbosus TaxID=931172 RepID=A0AAV6TGB7_9ARAC|nr:hypothetical protein JTE90_012645 [Oedothorax gibbosus]